MVSPVQWSNIGKVHSVDTAADDHFTPKIVQLINGDIVVAYVTSATTGPASPAGQDIVAKIYSSTGELIRDEFRLNIISTGDDEMDFELAADSSGGFSVVYEDDGLGVGDPSYNLRYEHFFANGNHDDSDSFVEDLNNTADDLFYRNPNVTSITSAAILNTYEKYDSSGNSVGIFGKIYNAGTNTMTGEFSIDTNWAYTGGTETILGHSTTTLTTGEHVVAFANGNAAANNEIYVRILNTDGSSNNQPGRITVDASLAVARDPHVTALSNGNFVVTWVADGSGGTDTGIRARVYNHNGGAVTATFTPATTTAGNQLYPTAAALEDGKFVVVWLDQDTRDILAQVYNANGTRDGVETVVQGYGNSTVGSIDVEGLDDGRFQVIWQVNLNDAGDVTVRSKIMDPRSSENSPNVYTTDQVIGTINADTIEVAPADDLINGWQGNDLFIFDSASDITPGDQFFGHTGTDTIRLDQSAVYNFRNAEIDDFEELEFRGNLTNSDRTAQFMASQIGPGLESNALIDGNNSTGSDDMIQIFMGAATTVDLSGWTFQDWNVNPNNTDRIQIIGDASSETMTGSSQNDEFLGNGGLDRMYGLAGNDTMTGGTGVNFFHGGQGSDTMFGNGGIDRFFAGPGNDFGNGGAQVDFMYGATGNDTFNGLGGNDRIFGDEGNDVLNGGDNNDTIRGGADNDTINGGSGVDTLQGETGNDTIHGDADGDNINGGSGNDNLFGDGGNDGIFGGPGSDMIQGGVGNDFLSGEGGFDTILGGAGHDQLFGGDLNDTLIGETGNDQLYGGTGNDNMNGGAGNDRLVSFSGSDTMTGGLGADIFEVNAAPGFDTITDYNAAQGDVIDVYLPGPAFSFAAGVGGIFLVHTATAQQIAFLEGLSIGDPVALM